MKHVFGASSHLVFYLCKRIIEVDSINPDDCIFFFTRNYHCPEQYNDLFQNQIHTEYNVTPQQGRVFRGIHFLQTRRNIREFDRMVDPYIQGEDFLWYSQVCNNDICSLFVSKKNCKGYFVLEDGLSSYRKDNPQSFTGWKYLLFKFVLKPFWKRCFEVKNHFVTTDHPKFKGCIGATKYSFPLHQQYLRCVGLPFESVDLGFTPDAVISIDPLFLWTNENAAVDIQKRVYAYVNKQNYKCVAYKFHPHFFAKVNTRFRNAYKKIIEENLKGNVMELPADICLENVMKTYTSDFYTSISAVCIYAHEYGSKCYSYLPILKESTHYFDQPIPLLDKFCIFIH